MKLLAGDVSCIDGEMLGKFHSASGRNAKIGTAARASAAQLTSGSKLPHSFPFICSALRATELEVVQYIGISCLLY